MTTIHLVYAHGPRISCPDAIGRHLGEHLETRYNVLYYNWQDTRLIRPGPADVLIGHPHPVPWTCFRRSARLNGWKRVLLMSPYHHGDDVQVAFLESVIRHCDLYLAITGNHWFSSIDKSLYSHWLPKMIHLDLAVDRAEFPPIKQDFNAPGQRRFVYIGNCFAGKNVGYLTQIAHLMPDAEVAWIGRGKPGIPGLRARGYQDFNTDEARNILAGYDFMLTVGKADANPATILETMAWGLIPVCTPESGYVGHSGIVNVPLDHAQEVVRILRQLQQQPDKQVKAWQAENWQLLDTHFNWDRFSRQVIDAIESNTSPALGHMSRARAWRIRWAALRSPHFYLRPRNLKRFLQAIYWENG